MSAEMSGRNIEIQPVHEVKKMLFRRRHDV